MCIYYWNVELFVTVDVLSVEFNVYLNKILIFIYMRELCARTHYFS